MRQSRQNAKPKVGICPSHVSREELADLLSLAPTSVSRLVQQGVLAKEAQGFPLGPNVKGYLAHVVAAEKRRYDRSPAMNELAQKKAHLLAIQIAEKDRSLIQMDEAEEVVDEIAGIYLESYGGLPSRLSRNPQEQTRIADIIEAERNRLADLFLERAKRLKTGPSQVEDEDDSE